MTPDTAPPQRILIVRLSALGDLVIATALLDGLRQAHPQAEIDWLVQPEFASFMGTQPAIAQLQVWQRKQWGQWLRGGRWWTLWQAVREFRRQLRERRYDWVIDAQGLAKSRLLAWLAGGRFRIGYTSKEPLAGLLHQTVQRFPEGAPERLAIGAEHAPMLRALTGHDIGAPRLRRPDLPANPACIVLAPFTTRPQKHWPEAHWRTLIAELQARGEPLALLGGSGDRAAADRLLVGLPPDAVHDLVGRTRLPEALAWIADAKALIGVDTGLSHMAIASDRPTVVLFGSTLPYRGGGRGPLQALWLGLPCSPCGRKPTCGGRWCCLGELTPGRALEALESVLSVPPRAGR